MRIIKRGVSPNEIEYSHTCSTCGTVFGFHLADITQRDDRDGTWFETHCPHEPCSKKLFIYDLKPLIT